MELVTTTLCSVAANLIVRVMKLGVDYWATPPVHFPNDQPAGGPEASPQPLTSSDAILLMIIIIQTFVAGLWTYAEIVPAVQTAPLNITFDVIAGTALQIFGAIATSQTCLTRRHQLRGRD